MQENAHYQFLIGFKLLYLIGFKLLYLIGWERV